MACGLIGSKAVDTVTNGLSSIRNVASGAVDAVDDISSDLSDLVGALRPIDVDIDLESAGTLSDAFDIGSMPTITGGQFSPKTIPAIDDVGNVRYNETAERPGNAPDNPPAIDLPDKPTPFDKEAPVAPETPERRMPDEPTEELPPVPTLRPIEIPSFSPLEFPEYRGIVPDDLVEVGFGNFDWEGSDYAPTVRQEVVDQLKAILGGSTGIPDMIWDMIEERGRKQLRATARQAREEAKDYWAAKGHFLSNGQLRKRIKEAGDLEREGVSELVRELVIQDAKIYVERLNTALAQGIAQENQLINLYNLVEERNFQVAKTIFEVRFRMAEYQVTAYNAKLQKFQIEAQIFLTLIQAEVAKLEEVKVRLEQQKLVGELNLQEVQLYEARIKGVLGVFEVFSKKIDAVVGQYEGDKIRIQAFSEKMKAFEIEQRAKETEWRGYGEAIKGELGIQESYKIASEIFGERVRAYSAGISADRARLDAEIEAAKLRLDKSRIDLTRAELEVKQETEKTRAENDTARVTASVYQTKGSIEHDRVTSDAQRLDILARQANMRMQGQIQETQMKIADAQNILSAQANALQAILSAQASVGSSALAALNYAATISESASNSTSCIDRYNTELS